MGVRLVLVWMVLHLQGFSLFSLPTDYQDWTGSRTW